jgi:hypothetical protein
MQGLPFLHSSFCSQSCAAALYVVLVTAHDPPFATVSQTAVPANGNRLISPQQLWPAGQSHEYEQCHEIIPVPHDVVFPEGHVPVGGFVSVRQHVLERRSHEVPQEVGLYVVQFAPVHAPLAQTWPLQALPLFCQFPVASQLCGCWVRALLPVHCTWPGPHTPWQLEPTPVPTHVWLVQEVVAPHVPFAVQDFCDDVVTHSTWFGAHWPWHEAVPPETRQVVLVHATGEPHAPLPLQVETPLLWHSVAPGVQVPWHDAVVPFATHAWLVHGTAVPHVPPEEQVWTAALPEHCEVPAAQEPVHAPLMHVAAPQATAAPH